jgi:hypothetical protein
MGLAVIPCLRAVIVLFTFAEQRRRVHPTRAEAAAEALLTNPLWLAASGALCFT